MSDLDYDFAYGCPKCTKAQKITTRGAECPDGHGFAQASLRNGEHMTDGEYDARTPAPNQLRNDQILPGQAGLDVFGPSATVYFNPGDF